MKSMKTKMITAALVALTAQAHAAESNLTDFNQIGNASWTSNGTEMRATTGNGFLVTRTAYGDFHLRIEFYAGRGTNSGVFFRCADPKRIDDKSCYEANIFDTRPDQTYRTGALTGFSAPKVILNTEDGAWHTYEIQAVGEKLRVLLDGKETIYTRNRNLRSGYIALQFAGGEIRFRKVEIKPLPKNALAPTKTALDGVWELESMEIIDPYGNATPWCVGSYGVIIYTRNYMSTAVNCTSEPSKSVLYSGPFEIQDGTVFHHAQNASNPDLNKVHRRAFAMKDSNHLELSGALGESKVVVKWVRR